MKIISKQKDYYDGVQAYGDNSIIYLRKQIEFNIKEHNKFNRENPNEINQEEVIESFDYFEELNSIKINKYLTHFSLWGDDFRYFTNRLIFIGFCGKIYNCVVFHVDINNRRFQKYCYSIDDYNKIFNLYTTKKEKKKGIDQHQEGIINKLSEPPTTIKYDLFFKYNTPSFVIIPSINHNDDKLIISPVLKKYQFAKVFDSYRAFQEIEMFLNGVLCDVKEPSVIDDKSMLFKKGFDGMSFKTEKGTKKPRSARRK